MNARFVSLLALGFLGACATTGAATGTGVQEVVQPAISCPEGVPESSWAQLSAPCRGLNQLARANQAADAGLWAVALDWATRAQAELEPPLSTAALFRIAEARYAMGQTVAAAADFRSVLGFGTDAPTTAEVHYYLAELAFSGNRPVDMIEHMGIALTAVPDAGWRLAAESLLNVAARGDIDWEAAQAVIPPDYRSLGQYLRGESYLRAHKQSEALKVFQGLVGDAGIAKLGLTQDVALRVEELSGRGTPRAGTVGIVLPLTGRVAPFGIGALRGILLGLDPYSRAGVELLIENDRGEPFRSVRGLRLVANDGAIAVIGPLLGKSVESAVPVAHTIGLPTIVLSSAELPPLAPWVIRAAVTPAAQIETLLAETMDHRGFKRFAILYPDDAFGKGMRDIFWDGVVSRGGQVTAVESYEPGKTDFKGSIRRLIGADEFSATEIKNRTEANQPLAHLDFDAVFLPDGARTVGLVIPQLLYHDVRGPVFIGPSTWNDPKLIELARDYAEGSLFVDWFRPEDTSAENVRFLKAFAATYGQVAPSSVTALGYESGHLLAESINQETRAAVRDSLRKKSWISFNGPATVRADGEVERALELLTITDRKIVPVDVKSGQ